MECNRIFDDPEGDLGAAGHSHAYQPWLRTGRTPQLLGLPGCRPKRPLRTMSPAPGLLARRAGVEKGTALVQDQKAQGHLSGRHFTFIRVQGWAELWLECQKAISVTSIC